MSTAVKSIVVLLLLCARLACAQAGAQAPCQAPTQGRYFPSFDDRNSSVIVFVHGVVGDPVSTWLHKRWIASNVFWPCLLLQDDQFAKTTNIYLHGFASDPLKGSPTIDEAANDLFAELDARGVLKQHSHISFVAHSMGGLVVSRMLLRKRDADLQKRLRMVLFFGTPATGADVAKIGAALSGNIQFKEMLDAQQLQRWRDRWITEMEDLPSFCGAEMKRVSLLPWKDVVVPEVSAAALCKGRVDRLYGLDHLQIVKPPTSQASPFSALYNRYVRCVVPKIRPLVTDIETPQGQTALRWFEEQQAQFGNAQAGGADLAAVAKTALHASRKFIAPSTGTANLTPADYEFLDANSFALVLRDQLGTSFASLPIETVIKVSRVHEAVKDRLILDLRDTALLNGTLVREDVAVIVRAPRNQDRVLFFIDPAPSAVATAAAAAPAGRLKGFVYLPDTSRCE